MLRHIKAVWSISELVLSDLISCCSSLIRVFTKFSKGLSNFCDSAARLVSSSESLAVASFLN